MTVKGVEVFVDANAGRRHGLRKLFKALDTMKDQDFDSVEDCVNLIRGFSNAIEVEYKVDEVEE